jgi:predicted RNA binding protein YcfA (HicA-like mRNA interferase family)
MGHKHPLLTPQDVVSIVNKLGFTFKRQKGSHAHYECPADEEKGRVRAVVTIDMSVKEFSPELASSMIRQSLRSKKEFYAALER